ncbi:MAG: biopolymer transporter ExbD [Nibricoccus sp.]
MITRPLDLLSKLRPPPRNYDFLFLVNGALIALFFSLFGSRFILSPGLRISGADLQIGSSPYAIEAAQYTRVTISVYASGEMWGDSGLLNDAQLTPWLKKQAKRAPDSVLLVIMDKNAPSEMLKKIYDAARAVGFKSIQLAAQQELKSE